ncbi:MAG: hypothetical protein ABIQ04_00535 [Candidatus Saccharimonadales bacterium]
MSKIKKTDNRPVVVSILGIIFIILTPFAQYTIGQLLIMHCPVLYGIRECGLDNGYKYAFYADAFAVLWLVIGLAILAYGLAKYFTNRKKANK